MAHTMDDHTLTNGPVGYSLLFLTIVFGWITELTMSQVTFIIAAVSGVSATVSFIFRSLRDYQDWKQKKKGSKGLDLVGGDTNQEKRGLGLVGGDTNQEKGKEAKEVNI